MKILTILGARPQFVKAAVLSRLLKTHPEVEEIIVHTGQHFDENMSDVFFEEMEIPSPKYNLQVNSLSHGAMTGRMIEKIEEVIKQENPQLVLVYGDTNSTLAGALAARKLGIKVAHVEAGLRSFNMAMPEEVNRILTDRISTILFCPTQQAVNNLQKEGFPYQDMTVIRTGDIMLDAATYYKKQAEQKAKLFKIPPTGKFALVTVHRQENTDDQIKLKALIDALNEINKEMRVFLPLHPRTQKKLKEFNIRNEFEIIDPVGYFDMLQLLSHCEIVLTDSGGLQKEAFFFRKPCLTLREETEWVELVENGVNLLSKITVYDILNNYKKISQAKPNFNVNLYGDGHSALQMIRAILKG